MNIEPPKALGTRPEPVGAPGCLTGMTFVISGQYETLTKDQTKDIVLRYGGRVTGSVSGKTTYLLKGRDAGLSKTSKAEQCGTKILNEDEFYDLINSFKEKPGVKGEKKNTDDVKKSPNRTSTESNPSGALSDRKSKGKASTIPTSAIHDSTVTAGVKSTDTASAALWTDKYKPKNLNEFIGNKEMVRRISAWLASYEQNRKNDFKARGDEINGFHAILISGPPGIGKTTAAHLIAKLNGYEALEYNASDARSKSILSEGITEMMDNRSITEFFRAPSSSSLASKEVKMTNHRDGKIVLIMDEVDGMTAGDRGGSAELARLIKISKIPVICICNDVRSPKVAPLLRVCFDARFKRTPASQIRSRMMTIAHHENMRLEPNAIDQLVELTHNDIRQLINILSMYRIKGSSMSYDQAKKVGSSNQKNSTMNTFQIPTALLPSSAWNSTSLNEKYDVYFHDYALASLMIQENYLKSKPGKAKNDCHAMELIAKAATAVADGDLVDAMIHGTVQHWSLMPVHSIFSCVRPAAYVNGHFSERINFPAWLGQNSKAMKYQRALSDIQTRMRVVSSGDKYEIRQNYVPLLTDKIVHSMEEKKFDETIEIMDTYYLDRDSLDTLNDIAFQRKKTDKQPFAGIPTANKTAFTRMYNSMSHPVLFQAAGIAVQKSVSAPKEDAVGTLVAEDEPLGEEAPLDEESDAEEDPEAEIEKDKFIKGKSKAAAAAKGKKRKATTSSSQSKSRKQAKTKK
ncbi:replication factor RFC1 C terminal domain-containing protein [Mycotypha africana]|uniref:replication factor RFC1 C terminal domain-containing protein n=1 Tax=Mycotypha africana TaxID=64632 RepID=UPI0023012FE2|nr:replication factor RFC1 C terminal domain-containing protein [Mycotypha africana]KAI8991740.1 replication factor RFC1 C terminal domain-containing protein [Mycotypha africana]